MKLLTLNSAKLNASQNDNWLNAVMYLEPSVDYKVICKGSSKGCRASCLTNSGMMKMPLQTKARIERTELFLNDNKVFNAKLFVEISELLKKANKQGKRLAIRLNGTSDLDFSGIYKQFPDVQFYEYTKRIDLIKANSKLENVDYTFSKHENHSIKNIEYMLANSINVTVVFDRKKGDLPKTYNSLPVIDGDKHDRRFEDTKGSIVGLSLKGTNRIKDLARQSGFAVK